MRRIGILPPSPGCLPRKQVPDGLPHPRLGMEKEEGKSLDRETEGGGQWIFPEHVGLWPRAKAAGKVSCCH